MKLKTFLTLTVINLCLFLAVLAMFPFSVRAEERDESRQIYTGEDCVDCRLRNPILPAEFQVVGGFGFIQKFITTAIGIGFLVGFILFFFTLLIGGVKWIIANGDKANVESAQKTITNALIGLVILLSIFAIIALIGQIFGVNLLKIEIPTL